MGPARQRKTGRRAGAFTDPLETRQEEVDHDDEKAISNKTHRGGPAAGLGEGPEDPRRSGHCRGGQAPTSNRGSVYSPEARPEPVPVCGAVRVHARNGKKLGTGPHATGRPSARPSDGYCPSSRSCRRRAAQSELIASSIWGGAGRGDGHAGPHRLQLFYSQFFYVGDTLLFDRFVSADLIGKGRNLES